MAWPWNLLEIILGWIYLIWLKMKPYVDLAIDTAIRAASLGNTYLYKFLYNNFTQVVKYITNVTNVTNKYITNVTQIITSWVASTWANITEFTGWLAGEIWGLLNSAWKSISDFTGWLAGEIWGLLNAAWKSISDFTGWLAGEIWGLLNSAWKSITDFTAWIAGEIWGLLNAAWKSITDFTAFLVTEIDKFVAGVVKQLHTWVENFVNAFVDACTNDFFLGLNKGIKEAHGSPLTVDKDSDNEILRGLQHYMKKYREERDKKEAK